MIKLYLVYLLYDYFKIKGVKNMSKKSKLKLGMALVLANAAFFATSPFVSADTVVTGEGSINVAAEGTAPDQTFKVSLSKNLSGIETINAGGALIIGDGSLAVNGSNITLIGKNSIAMGDRTTVLGDNAFALGSGSQANGSNSVAMGGGVATLKNSVAIGLNAISYKPGSVAIGAGSHTKDVDATANKYTIGEGMGELTFASNDKNRAVSFGEAGDLGETRTLQNVSAGKLSDTSTDAVNGSQLHMVANALHGKIMEANTAATEAKTLATDANTAVTAASSAAKTAKKDASAAKKMATQNKKSIDKKANKNADNIDVQQWKAKLGIGDGMGTDMSKEINNLREDIKYVGAHSAALAAMKPLDYNPMEKTQFMAGVGRYKGQSAYALGLAIHANRNMMFNTGLSFGEGSPMVNAGVAWRFGAESQMDATELMKKGASNAMYRMADELNAVKSENMSLRKEMMMVKNENMSMHKKMMVMDKEYKQVQDEMMAMKKQLAKLMSAKM